MTPEHYAVDSNVLRGVINFRGSKVGRARFLNAKGQQVTFSTQPMVQLTLLDTTLAPAWRSKFIKENGLFVGIEVAFGAAQAIQSVEWTVQK